MKNPERCKNCIGYYSGSCIAPGDYQRCFGPYESTPEMLESRDYIRSNQKLAWMLIWNTVKLPYTIFKHRKEIKEFFTTRNNKEEEK